MPISLFRQILYHSATEACFFLRHVKKCFWLWLLKLVLDWSIEKESGRNSERRSLSLIKPHLAVTFSDGIEFLEVTLTLFSWLIQLIHLLEISCNLFIRSLKHTSFMDECLNDLELLSSVMNLNQVCVLLSFTTEPPSLVAGAFTLLWLFPLLVIKNANRIPERWFPEKMFLLSRALWGQNRV